MNRRKMLIIGEYVAYKGNFPYVCENTPREILSDGREGIDRE
jgi:hypothetical protein